MTKTFNKHYIIAKRNVTSWGARMPQWGPKMLHAYRVQWHTLVHNAYTSCTGVAMGNHCSCSFDMASSTCVVCGTRKHHHRHRRVAAARYRGHMATKPKREGCRPVGVGGRPGGRRETGISRPSRQ